MSRIKDKINQIQEYLEELENVIPNTFQEYKTNLEKRLASERAFEKIIEAASDLAILIIKEKRYEFPEEDSKAFDILEDKSLISKELSEKLKQAKGMRNFLAHQYGKIDDELVFETLQNDISKDIHGFLNLVEKSLQNN